MSGCGKAPAPMPQQPQPVQAQPVYPQPFAQPAQPVQGQPPLQKGNVEPAPVVMDQTAVLRREDAEGRQDLFLIDTGIIEPLDHMPSFGLIIGAADQIDMIVLPGQAGGLNIYKEQVRSRADQGQGGFIGHLCKRS